MIAKKIFNYVFLDLILRLKFHLNKKIKYF